VEASSGRPGAARRVEPLLLALSLLTLVTGLVDAACYLGLGRVFTANMTGNVVLLAFGATGVTITLLLELLLVAVAGVVALGLPVGGGGARRYVVIGLLAAGLGLQNATVRRLAVPDVTTTVLTLTLTGLAADSWLAGGRSPRAGRRVAAVGLMAAGALAGALLLRVDVALPVLAAALVIALAAAQLRFGR
jgi:uncharacterized membrane protein YoaK (UPF0700 family)